jgi:hypothetical protein
LAASLSAASLQTSPDAHRHLVPNPTHLILPQSNAFAILGHSCGGITEHQYVTGFDASTGFPTGAVFLTTTCSSGGIGGNHVTYTAWAAVTWDFAGNVVSSTATTAPTVDPSFHTTDAYGDTIYNAALSAYLVVPFPGAPHGVTAVQSGDLFQVSWTTHSVNPAAIASTTLTATPVNSSAPVLTMTVTGPTTNGVLSPLQPQTTYQITVVNTTVSGSGPASPPIYVTTSPATEPPGAPTGLTAHWTNQDPSGTTDTIIATWQAAYPGNSPIDQYLVKITGSDGGGTFTQTVSGSTLIASFTVDWTPNWSVTVQAHNGFGWGPVSSVFTLGGL